MEKCMWGKGGEGVGNWSRRGGNYGQDIMYERINQKRKIS